MQKPKVIFSTVFVLLVCFIEIENVFSKKGNKLLQSLNLIDQHENLCEEIVSILAIDHLNPCETIPQYSSVLCKQQLDIRESVDANKLNDITYPLIFATSNSMNDSFIFESQINNRHRYLEISLVVWMESSDIQQLFESLIQDSTPSIEIEVNQDDNVSSVERRKYPLRYMNERFYSFPEGTWRVFRFDGYLEVRGGGGGDRISIPILQIKLMVNNNARILLESLRILQSNQFDKQQLSCDDQNKKECSAPNFEFQPLLQACVFQAEFKCPLDLIERISDHSCVVQCPSIEFVYSLPSEGTAFCLQGFQTCDQKINGRLVGCRTCDRFNNICFECEEGYYLNEMNYLCEIFHLQMVNSMSLMPRKLYSGNCARPTCSECLKGNICLLCMSPFVNVHGACVLCGLGTIIEKSTEDWYCRKTTDKLGCSNFNQVSGNCQGCFLGVISPICDQNLACPSAGKFQAGVGICKDCSNYDPNCQKCATANQCHVCKPGYKLAIQNYSVLNPNVVCVLTCATGFFEDSFGFCAPCGSNCDACTQSSLKCSSCKSGFEVDKKYSRVYPARMERCIPVIRCPVNCISCSDSNICDSCPFGYALVNGSCEKCSANCKVCSDGSTCIECIDGGSSPPACSIVKCSQQKYLSENLICEACIANCQLCWNADSCDICMPGYVMEKNSCLPCQANCRMCYDQNTCMMCEANYYLYANVCIPNPITCTNEFYNYSSTSCKPCVGSCSTCTNLSLCTGCLSGIGPVLGKCSLCSDTQYYSTTFTCQSCPANCNMCVTYSGCLQCSKGYSLNLSTGSCDPVALCGDGDMVKTFAIHSKVITKQCDDRNTTDGDGCDSNCQIEADYTCTYVAADSKSTCKKNSTNRFWLETKTNSENLHPIIVVKFDSSISLLRNLRQLTSTQESLNQKAFNSMVIDIEDTSSDVYSYTVNANQYDSQKSINVEFTVKKNIINKHIQISFLSTFVSANSLTNTSEKTLFPDTRPVDEGDKKIADAIATAGSVAGKSFLITVIPVILFSKFSFLFNALDLFQMIYYLQFVNIRFPYNVSEFLRIMSNFKVPFSLNFIKWFLEANPVVSPIVPTKFTEKQIDGVFLKNAGDHYSQVTIIIVVHLILVVIAKATVNSSVGFVAKAGGFLDEKLTASWQWGWYLDKFWEMFLSIVVGCALQFYGLNSGDFQSAINTVFFIVSVAMILLSPLFFWKKIHKNKRTLKSKSTEQKWGMLYEGLTIHSRNSQIFPVGKDGLRLQESNSELKVLSINQSQIYSDNSPSRNNNLEQIQESALDSSLNQSAFPEENSQQEINEQKNNSSSIFVKFYQSSKYFYVGLYVRKIFFGAFIGGLYNFTLTQLILIDSLNLFIVIFLTAVKPYEKFMHGFKAIICELLMITAQFSLKFLIDDPADGDESDRMKIGWVFVGACIAILIIQMVFVLVSLCMDLCKQVSDWLKKRKQKQGEQELDVSESQSVQNAEGSNVIDLEETTEIKKVDLESSNQSTNRKFKSGNKSRVSRLKKIQQSSAGQQEIELGQIGEEDLSQSKPNFQRNRKK